MATLVPPAKGLTQLTWKQIEDLDAAIRSLCLLTQQTDEEIHLPIIIKRGKPMRIGRPMIMDSFKPTGL